LRHLVANVPAMLGRDETALHQMRVALRRPGAPAISLFFGKWWADDRAEALKDRVKMALHGN